MLLMGQRSVQLFNKKHFSIILWVCLYHFQFSYSQWHFSPSTPEPPETLLPCHVPTGRASFCVPVDRCKQLSGLIRNLQKPIPGDVAKYIKDSFFCQSTNKVCCPFRSIINPRPANRPSIRSRDEKCTVQSGETGSCTVYFKCRPILALLSNLRRPFPAEVPRLMQSSILCGRENVDGNNLPKVCCPKEAVQLTDTQRFAAHPNRGVLAAVCPSSYISNRIIGGKETYIGEYPWLALLGYRAERGQKIQWRCGGALIGDQYILTAAHCINRQLSKIRLGEHTISNEGRDCSPTDRSDCNLGHQDFDIEKVVMHPSYNLPVQTRNDIALIKLKNKISPNKFVVPICLPYDDDVKEDYRNHNYKINNEVYVAGWGVTGDKGKGFKRGSLADTLQHLNMSIFDGDKCREIFTRTSLVSEDSQLCAGGESGRDSCFGDSGSALMTTHPKHGTPFETWKLIGIVSFGASNMCGAENIPGVYSRVRHFIQWILDNVDP